MDLLDFAKDIEMQGKKHYTVLAERMPIRELAGIFMFFAKEEERHFEIFDAWQKKMKIPPLENAGIIGRAREVFPTLVEKFRTRGIAAVDYEDAYAKALSLEEKSIALYENARDKYQDPGQQALLERIIGQEKLHAQIITSLMEFQRHPHEWLENAEWYHTDEF
jgi:rubrerythrin